MLYVSGRRMGKTTELIRALELNPRSIYVTFNRASANMVAQDYPRHRARIISLQEYMRIQHGLPRDMQVLVDNLEMMLVELFCGRIVFATATPQAPIYEIEPETIKLLARQAAESVRAAKVKK